jgi:hypothetical protein
MAIGQTTSIDRLLIQLDLETKRAQSGVKEVDQIIGNIDKRIAKAKQTAGGFDKQFKFIQGTMLGVGLSFLFTGMAIKRFFQGILTSLFQTFLQVEGQTGPTNEALAELQALLEFVKFSFIDAFVDTGLLDVWINRIETLVNWFNNLSTETKGVIISFSVWGLVLGTILMVVGQVTLGFLGVFTLINALIKSGFIAWIGKLFSGFKALTIGGVFNLFLALFAIFILLPKLISRFGGLKNFAIAVFAGIAKAATMLGGFLINGILVVLEMLIAAAAKLANIVGLKGIAGALSSAAFAIDKARRGGQANITGALQTIDTTTGAGEVRNQMTNNITIEGNADEGVIENLLAKLEERLFFNQGSPQQ